MKVSLSDDGWAVLRDTSGITNGERKPLMRHALAADKDDPDAALTLGEFFIAFFVTEWSLAWPLPSIDPIAFDQMRAEDYDRLQYAVGELMNDLIWQPDPKVTETTA